MTYRHTDHAGNHGDCLKHSLLAWLLNELRQNTPEHLIYIDSHAGAGHYAIDDRRRRQLAPLFKAPPKEATPYITCLNKAQSEGGDSYPGSPQIAAHLLRETDRLKLIEWSGETAQVLRKLMLHDVRVELFESDGYITLPYLLHQIRHKGLALIDPPYGQASEQTLIEQSLNECLRYRPDFIYALWYPIIAGERPEILNRDIGAKRPQCMVELHLSPSGPGMSGSGLMVVNPPLGFITAAQILLDWLNQGLAQGGGEVIVL